MWQIHATYIKINEVKPIISVPLFVQLIIIVCDFINVLTQVEYWLVKIFKMFFGGSCSILCLRLNLELNIFNTNKKRHG